MSVCSSIAEHARHRTVALLPLALLLAWLVSFSAHAASNHVVTDGFSSVDVTTFCEVARTERSLKTQGGLFEDDAG